MRAILAAILLTLAGCAEARPEHSAHSVRIDLTRGLCSATVVARNVLLTAAHCFDEGNRLTAIDGEPAYALEIVRDGQDHVLVRVNRHFTRWATMGPAPRQGDHVSWIGTPAGNSGTYREGYVMRVMPEETWLSAQAFGGDSGSGVIGTRGNVVGVVTGVRVWRDRIGNTFTAVVLLPLAFSDEQWREIRS